jgi:hypothetical protein
MWTVVKIFAIGLLIGLFVVLGRVSWISFAYYEPRDHQNPDKVVSSVQGADASQGENDSLELGEPLTDEMVLSVERFCGDCHALPDPTRFARHHWVDEIKRGYEFYARSGRIDLNPPSPATTLNYYLTRALEQPQWPVGNNSPTQWANPFRAEKRFMPTGVGLPEISTLIWGPLRKQGSPQLLAGDMKYGQIVAIDPNKSQAAPLVITRLKHPGRIIPVSLSGDDSTEFIVADLGTYMPDEEARGSVVLLRRPLGAPTFETIEIATGFTRVSDVQVGDFDGDGKPDLIVAEFGWQLSGGIWLLRNTTEREWELRFERTRIDDRPGTIKLEVLDFDGDGKSDFLAITSQEYETIDLYLNKSSGDFGTPPNPNKHPFAQVRLWEGHDLTFGSSHLMISDLNQDGLPDIVFSSGDTWDNLLAVQSHGIHWLENLGDLEFRYQQIAKLPGAYSFAIDDFNRDGQLDIIAVSWLAPAVKPDEVSSGRFGSIIMLEQTEDGQFLRHTLETGSPHYSTIVSGDFDGDGDIDFAVASGPMVAENRRDGCYLTIWRSGIAP